ncbi:hypothetical protein MesoLjLb_58790 [Mesorhizobium sp. L-8-3]|nr:hypothetical protein MesoLjLb_58790 [Mesorhizobium sp. L-8-3]
MYDIVRKVVTPAMTSVRTDVPFSFSSKNFSSIDYPPAQQAVAMGRECCGQSPIDGGARDQAPRLPPVRGGGRNGALRPLPRRPFVWRQQWLPAQTGANLSPTLCRHKTEGIADAAKLFRRKGG